MSLLFQLPSELRNAIWDLLYGDKDVMVRFFTTRTRTSERIPKYNIYDRSRRNEQHLNGLHMPKTVSKQFWEETMSVFFATAVFDFDSADAFQNFATSHDKQATIVRIKRLRIRCGVPWDLTIFWAIWAATLNVFTLRPFESLRGFEWIVTHYTGGPEEQLQELRLTDNEVVWSKSKLMLIIRGFQQHRLRPELTSVRFQKYREKHTKDHTESQDIALGGEVREMMLKGRPRNVSPEGFAAGRKEMT